jgi:hypothetical protein
MHTTYTRASENVLPGNSTSSDHDVQVEVPGQRVEEQVPALLAYETMFRERSTPFRVGVCLYL